MKLKTKWIINSILFIIGYIIGAFAPPLGYLAFGWIIPGIILISYDIMIDGSNDAEI